MAMTVLDKKEQQKLAQKLVKKTHVHFHKLNIEVLLQFYHELTHKKMNKKMDRYIFRDFLKSQFDMTDSVMMDNIYRVFDTDNDNYISMEEWVKGMSVFTNGDRKEKIKFCFDVYDLNGDGIISRDEIFQLLKDSLISKHTQEEDPDDPKRELVDLLVKLLNSDKVTLAEFEKAVNEQGLLLECLGQCLPDETRVADFDKAFFRDRHEHCYFK